MGHNLHVSYCQHHKDAELNFVDLITTNSPNFGRGRRIPPNPNLLFHKSVRAREQDPKLKYKPRARYEKGTESYVD